MRKFASGPHAVAVERDLERWHGVSYNTTQVDSSETYLAQLAVIVNLDRDAGSQENTERIQRLSTLLECKSVDEILTGALSPDRPLDPDNVSTVCSKIMALMGASIEQAIISLVDAKHSGT